MNARPVAPPAVDSGPVASISFEQALDELDTAYRRGAELARFCQNELANAEQEIKRLEGDVMKPLDISELRVGEQGAGKGGTQ